MSRKIKFYIVDVFGKEKYTGNQLAVFINTIGIDSEEMQKMAREINFSETTFVNPQPNMDGSYNVRIFTPASEVDFAGHPTLGTAYIISKKILNDNSQQVTLNLKVGKIPVESSNDSLWMKQVAPKFGNTFDVEQIANVLGIAVNAIDCSYPIEEVSTGLPFTIVPLKNMTTLKKCKIQQTNYQLFIKQAWAKGILVFTKEPYTKNQSIAVRVFVDYLGIPEDPATGSGNGCLAAYLVKHNCLNKQDINIAVGQGYEINRPSELYLKAGYTENKYSIQIGGKSFLIAEGDWE
jgi:trans-2,3-dihydro-3-hydroxyanthranilate isomerase